MTILNGKSTTHLTQLTDNNHYLHSDIVNDFLELQAQAHAAGFDLQIASSFRDYSRQLLIWNEKVTGKRKLYDENSQELNSKELTPQELLFAILHWSAIPGLSRHHLGTDFDFFDGSNIAREDLELIPSEYTYPSGPCFKLNSWIDQQIQENSGFPFYRPFDGIKLKVAFEPWHLSHRAVANKLLEPLSFDSFVQHIENTSDILLSEEILKYSELIYTNYIKAK